MRTEKRGGRAGGELQAVGPLLSQILRRLGLDRRFAEQRAVETWAEAVGADIAAQSRAAGIRDGVLFVDVASNVWMQELGLLRENIVERLNQRLGAPLVKRIVLSIDRGPRPEGAPTWEWEGEHPDDE
jgi:predicted nucleic acid-binding Zn ribbon protein